MKRILGWVREAGSDANVRTEEVKELTWRAVPMMRLNAAANMKDYRKNNSSPHSRLVSSAGNDSLGNYKKRFAQIAR